MPPDACICRAIDSRSATRRDEAVFQVADSQPVAPLIGVNAAQPATHSVGRQ
jgi:hypothetical protein